MNIVSYNEIVNYNSILAPSQLSEIQIPNKNVKNVSEMLDRQLTVRDKGNEVGTINYITSSTYYFIRAKALQKKSFLPDINAETAIPVRPQVFTEYNLCNNDLIISKDSNIGESILLDKDYPNYMLSGALYKLPISKYKHYLYAFLKDEYFLKQLDVLVPKGSTIRHAKNLFLNCNIPFPNQSDSENVIELVEMFVKIIVDKEKQIRTKSDNINNLITNEILTNQNNISFKSECTTYNDLIKNNRIDTGIYDNSFKKIQHLILNYNKGYFFIDRNNIKSGSTPTKRTISNTENLTYCWITPTAISEYGTIENYESINCATPNLRSDALLLINRTSKGGLGEYVGMSMFYDFKQYGLGQHNQGIYRVVGYHINKLIMIGLFLNNPIMRTYCAHLSIGSKMKEIKLSQFLQIPFPNFGDIFTEKIVRLYKNSDKLPNSKSIKDYLENELNWNSTAGIFELSVSIKETKVTLSKILQDIKNNIKIDVNSFIDEETTHPAS